MYTCMCVYNMYFGLLCVRTYIRTCVHCACMCVYVFGNMHLCACVRACVRACVCVCVCVCTHVHAYMHAAIVFGPVYQPKKTREFVCEYVYLYTHTYMQLGDFGLVCQQKKTTYIHT